MIRSFSYGGGVQSTACLVLAAQGKIDFPLFIFANVGDDSEHPDTLAYVRNVAVPYAAANGIEFVIAAHKRTLYEEAIRDNRRIPLPAYMSNGAPGKRTCTADFKIRVIARELRRRGATKANPAVVGLGISIDEVERARTDSGIPHEILEYPLLDLGLNRGSCAGIIERAGLPVPGKSACWFCPFQSNKRWGELRRERPDLFAKACALESRINEKRNAIGRDIVHLHKSRIDLVDAIPESNARQLDMFEGDVCDSGYCFL